MAHPLLCASPIHSPRPLEWPAKRETDNTQSSATPGLLCASPSGTICTEYEYYNGTVVALCTPGDTCHGEDMSGSGNPEKEHTPAQVRERSGSLCAGGTTGLSLKGCSLPWSDPGLVGLRP